MEAPHDESAPHQHGHGLWQCSGEPVMTEGGSWIGHFFPGLVFFIWGLHWLQGTFRTYFASLHAKGGEYRAQTTYSLWIFPAYAESVCKAVFPVFAICLELYFAHTGGYRMLVCPADTERSGHFDGRHIGNWQHAAMYPGFIMAGIVDLVGYSVELPPGTQQVFLSLAFVCESLLMGLHKKHLPLDVIVHELLVWAMVANALAVLLEAIYPRNFLVSCARIGTTLLQCGWFWAATRMMFENRAAWDDMEGGDMAPVMMAPVFFVGLIICIICGLFAVYLAFHLFYQLVDARAAPAASSSSSAERCVDERAGLLDEERGGGGGADHHRHGHGHGQAKQLPLSTLPTSSSRPS